MTALGRHKPWLIALLAAVAAVVLFAAFGSRRGETLVSAVTAERKTIVAAIDTDGKVEPINNFQAHAPAATTVQQIVVHEGQQVRKGDLLLRLNDTDARAQAARATAQVRAAEANMAILKAGGTREEVLTTQTQLNTAQTELKTAEKNLETMRRLHERGAASTAEVSIAQNRVSTDKAQVELLQKKLDSRYSDTDLSKAEAEIGEAKASLAAAQDLIQNANIHAPNAGTVYSLPVRQGQFVSPGDLLVQVASLEEVQVRAFVDEPEIGRLREGQEVTITWNALPEKSWQGRITHVPTTVVTRGTRTVGEVTALIGNSDRQLLPAVNVSVKIVTQKQPDAIVLPREAVRGENSERYVLRIQDGSLQRQPIETGISNLTQIQITKGLQEGTRIATTSLNGVTLQEGMGVRVGNQ